MYDVEKLSKMISDIEKYFAELNKFGLNESNIQNSEKFYASSMAIFGILNRMIDVAEEIILKNQLGIPQRYEEYFEVLAKNASIDRKLAEELKKLTKDRNIFAHAYYDLAKKDILNILKRVSNVKNFVEKVKKIINKEAGNAKKE